MNDSLGEELEAVEAILMERIDVDRNEESDTTDVEIALHPLTANDNEKKYVSLTLRMTMTKHYPDREPKVQVRERK
jgi:hypothetical protein